MLIGFIKQSKIGLIHYTKCQNMTRPAPISNEVREKKHWNEQFKQFSTKDTSLKCHYGVCWNIRKK